MGKIKCKHCGQLEKGVLENICFKCHTFKIDKFVEEDYMKLKGKE